MQGLLDIDKKYGKYICIICKRLKKDCKCIPRLNHLSMEKLTKHKYEHLFMTTFKHIENRYRFYKCWQAGIIGYFCNDCPNRFVCFTRPKQNWWEDQVIRIQNDLPFHGLPSEI